MELYGFMALIAVVSGLPLKDGYEIQNDNISYLSSTLSLSLKPEYFLPVNGRSNTFLKKTTEFMSSEPCKLQFNPVDVRHAKREFNKGIQDNEVFQFFFYLSPSNDFNYKHLIDKKDYVYWNGLQEWIWFKEEYSFYAANLPVDLDDLTFSISHYGSKNIEIRWNLTGNCNQSGIINYEKEAKRIMEYMWNHILINETLTESQFCHRNFIRDKTFLEVIYIVFTIWNGYDFDCYSVKLLEKGIFDQPDEKSKDGIIRILLVVVGCFGYMYPFLLRFVETLQPTRHYQNVFGYYKETMEIEKPYSIVRCGKKMFFYDWKTFRNVKNMRHLKYIPVIRMFFLIALLMVLVNIYLESEITNEFNEKGTELFPDVYRNGPIEYSYMYIGRWRYLVIGLTAIFFFVSSTYTYILYNGETKTNSIFCIPLCIMQCDAYFTPIEKFVDIKNVNENNVVTDFDNNEILTASKKLIFRFTMIFKFDLWRFVFLHSFVPRIHHPEHDNIDRICLFEWILTIFLGPIVFSLNVCFVIIAAIPPFYFLFFLIRKLISGDCNCSRFTCFVMLLFYLSSLREHIHIFVFLLRAFFYTLLIGFIGPEHIFRFYIVLIGGLTYFLIYFNTFVNSYNRILKFIFEKIIEDPERDFSIVIQDDEVKDGHRNMELKLKENQSNKNNNEFYFEEKRFNFIVDNCFSVQQNIFVLVLKTCLTSVLFYVTFVLLELSGTFTKTQNIQDIISSVAVLLSPQIVNLLLQSPEEQFVKSHETELKDLHKRSENCAQRPKYHDQEKKFWKENCKCCWFEKKDCCECCKSCECCIWVSVVVQSICLWRLLTADHDEPRIYSSKYRREHTDQSTSMIGGIYEDPSDLKTALTNQDILHSNTEHILQENIKMVGLTENKIWGNEGCFFKAVSEQLERIGRQPQTPEDLRKNAIEFLKTNQDLQKPDGKVNWSTYVTDQNIEAYRQSFNQAEEVDGVIIMVMSAYLKCDIAIVTSNQSPIDANKAPQNVIWITCENNSDDVIFLATRNANRYYPLRPVRQCCFCCSLNY